MKKYFIQTPLASARHKIQRLHTFWLNALNHYKTHGVKSLIRQGSYRTTSLVRLAIADWKRTCHENVGGNQRHKGIWGNIVHDPFVTVIAVNYNGAHDLPEFLHSLSLQSYQHFELIIVDNGSTDDSKEIVEQQHARPPRTSFICTGKNLGFAEGNNFALSHAKGEFLALLNIDTKVHEDWLRELVEALRHNGSAAAATSKILFWSRFEDLVIEGDTQISIDLDALTSSLSYKKYFLRSGIIENGQAVSDRRNQLVLSLPIQAAPILLKFTPPHAQGLVRFSARNKTLFRQPLSECHTAISIDFSLKAISNAGFVINNAGSVIGQDGMPCDRGFGEYDCGQYDSKCYVPYFCACSVLIRRAALLERPIFIPEFFAYYEDSELSRWLTDHGQRLLYVPRSIVFHRHSATSSEGSPLWKLLVRRSSLIFSHSKDISLLSNNLDRVRKEFGPHIKTELENTLSELDAQLIKKLTAGRSYDRQKPIGIYNSFWNTRGGGESHALSIASELQELGPVELISETDFDLDALAHYFSLDLSNCRKLILPKIPTTFTEKFFLFINASYGSLLSSQAINSWYIVSFPQRFAPNEFLHSYRFLFNSNYTQKWAHTYWGSNIKGEVIYPIRMFHLNQVHKNQQALNKKKLILSVGRFFPSDHCKNQLEIAEAYRLLVSRFPEASEWKLVLAGTLDTRHAEHVAYYEMVQEKLSGLNAELRPNLRHDLLNELYSEAAIYVHAAGMGQDPIKSPENFEHFGITPLEAMLSGAIPVVFSIGGPAEMIDLLQTGYKFSSIESLVESLALLIKRGINIMRDESVIASTRAANFVASESYKTLPQLHDSQDSNKKSSQ